MTTSVEALSDVPATPSTLADVPNNLPVQLTSFVGRSAELDAVRQALESSRLVTLTGPGGSGKTRLAWQVVTALGDRCPDGVWWVELAELTDGGSVADAAATAMGAIIEPVRGSTRSVTAHLADHRALVCLDNAEHLLDSVASLVEALLRAAPDVTVLVTSREPIGVPGEVVWRVPPLDDHEAVALFVERARTVRPGFELGAASEAAVRSIAIHLDGIPLALELAAAWLGTLTPREIEASLDDRFTLLVRGPRGAHRRQQTLAGSIDWSHALLDRTDRILFRRLGAFAGSFGQEAARWVCVAEPIGDILPALSRLVDKSLVIAEEHNSETRYRMLETIRAYAAARLVEAREDAEVRDRHLDWAIEFAEVRGALRALDPDGLRGVRLEYANLRAALDRALAAEDPWRGRRLAAALAWFWHLDRRGREGMDYLRRAIARQPDDRSRIQAGLMTGVALVADTAGPLDLEYDAATGALELATEVGDESLRALCLMLAAVGAFYTDFDAAWDLCEEAHRAAETGSNPFVVGGSRALQAIILHLRDRHVEAEAVIDETVRGHLRLHRGVLSTVLGFHAQGALATGDAARARTLAEEGLRLAQPLGDYLRVGMARSTLASIRARSGDPEGAQAAIEPVLRDLDDAGDGAFVPGLAQAAGTIGLRRGDSEGATGWFARDAQSTDRGLETYIAGQALPKLGMTLAILGRRSESESALERGLTVGRRLGMPAVIAEALHGQATLAASDDEELERAADLAHAGLAERKEHGLRAAIPDSLELLAELGSRISPTADDVRVLAASDAARESMGLPRGADGQPMYAATLVRLRASLGDAFDVPWSEGARLTLEEAVAYARRSRGTRGRPSTGWASLTPTELDVVGHVAEGLTNLEIGARLFMSRGTVKTHLSHIFTKLDVSNRTELARLAARHHA